MKGGFVLAAGRVRSKKKTRKSRTALAISKKMKKSYSSRNQ